MNRLAGTIGSELAQVEPVCREVRELLRKGGLSRHEFAVDLLLREFLNNAIVHGNRQDPAKRVGYVFRVGPKQISIVIHDEGAGFRPRQDRFKLPDPAIPGGRGLAIGKEYADRLQYNRNGTEVRLWIRIEKRSVADV